MANSYYTFTPAFVPGTRVRSDAVNLQYQAIEAAFDQLPSDVDALTTGTATFAPESGSGNAYVVTMPNTRTSNTDGDEIVFFATHTNTGATTLNVDGIGALALVRSNGTALVAGDIVDGIAYSVRFDATNVRFQLMSPNNSFLTDSEAAATAAAASETAAAASAVEAMQWAVHPEDDDVDSAPGQFSAFHWAQKALGAASTNRVLTDIATATPPTSEAVSGEVQIFDADETDQLARYGFIASNTLSVDNLMHGGSFEITGEDLSGVRTRLLFGNPLIGVDLYYQGDIRLTTFLDGVSVRGAHSNDPALGGTYNNQFVWNNATGAQVGGISYIGTSNLHLSNAVHGGNLILRGENTSGSLRTFLEGDPDGSTVLFDGTGSGFSRLATQADGVVRVRSNLSVDTSPKAVEFAHQDDTVRGLVGYGATSDLALRNQIHGGDLLLTAENISGTERTLLLGDPDGSTSIYNIGTERLVAESSGTASIKSDGNLDTETRLLEFRHQDDTVRSSLGQNGGADLDLRNLIHGGRIRLQAEDAGGVNRNILIGDPDAETAIYRIGTEAMRTTDSGIRVRAATGTLSRIDFSTSADEIRGEVEHDGSNFIVRNLLNGGQVRLAAEDNGGTDRLLFLGDPDGTSALYHIGLVAAQTLISTSGGFQVDNDLTGAGLERVLTVSDGFINQSKAADTARNTTTTVTDDPDLDDLDMLADEVYEFKAAIAVSGPAAGDFKFRIDGTSLGVFNVKYSAFNSVSIVSRQRFDPNVEEIVAVGSPTDPSLLIIEGYIRPTANTSIAFQWAQFASDATDTVVEEGSFWSIRKVS